MSANLKTWQRELRERLNPKQLFARFPCLADRITDDQMRSAHRKFPVAVTEHYASLIKNRNDDPLLRIVGPDARELEVHGMDDQSGEGMNTEKTGIPGLQHKYAPTVLVGVTGMCASYCRFCFRRRSVGTEAEAVEDFDKALDYIRSHHEINNVLLSGGDAFMLENYELAHMLSGLRRMDHVGSIRLGTKMPVYLPSRFDDYELMGMLSAKSLPGKRIYVVSHIEHLQELCPEAMKAHERLARSGVIMISQIVLFKGINDRPAMLAKMFRKMSEAGIRPYYVFQGRPVRGGTHMRISLLEGHNIVEKAKKELPGFAKPRYAMSHVSGKIEIMSIKRENKKNIGVFSYHESRDPDYLGKSMVLEYSKPAFWLDDIFSQPHTVLLGDGAADYAKEQSRKLV